MSPEVTKNDNESNKNSVELRCNLIRHISAIYRKGEQYTTVQSISHCVRSADLLLDSLQESRRSTANGSTQTGDILRLATYYLSLILSVLRLANSKQHRARIVEALANCPEVLLEEGQTTISSLVEYFSSKLVQTQYSAPAYFILQIISNLSLEKHDEDSNGRVVEMSWKVLHSVFTESDDLDVEHKDFPQPQENLLKQMKLDRSQLSSLREALQSTLTRLYDRPSFTRDFAAHRNFLILHWGLISQSPHDILRFSGHITEFVAQLHILLKNMEQNAIKASKRTRMPCLDAVTFPEFFETLTSMNLTALSAAQVNSRQKNYSPFQHLKVLVRLYRRTLDLYLDHFALFPQKSISMVARLTKDMLVVAVTQLHRCANWRNEQPVLPFAERASGRVDPGSMAHLQELIDLVAGDIVGTARILGQFALEAEQGTEFPFKRTGVLTAVQKAEREVKDLSTSHHLPVPRFQPQEIKDDIMNVTSTENHSVKGFSLHDTTTEEMDCDESEGDEFGVLLDEDMHQSPSSERNSGEESFEVAGSWPDQESDDNSTSTAIQTIAIVKTA